MVPCGYNNRKNNVEKGKIWRVGVAGDTPFQFFPFSYLTFHILFVPLQPILKRITRIVTGKNEVNYGL